MTEALLLVTLVAIAILVVVCAFLLAKTNLLLHAQPTQDSKAPESCQEPDSEETVSVTTFTERSRFSITRFFFVLVNVCAIIWVFISYGIAIYSTIALGQTYTMSELSEPAINTILGVTVMKVVENIFEHNESWLFGYKKGEKDD